MIVHIYDTDGRNKTIISDSITRIFFSGTKAKLWQWVGHKQVRNYEYVWFLDDDLLSSKHVLPFDQFLYVVRKFDSVISSPKSIRKGDQQQAHKLTIASEMLGNQFAEEFDYIEANSFMFNSYAWVFFHDHILIDTPNSDWGPDYVWCYIFSIHNFGKMPCLHSNHFGLMHMNTHSLGRKKNEDYGKENAHAKALKLYKEKAQRLYIGTHLFRFIETRADTLALKSSCR